jgi:uncharacterized cupredoxin-like copper-binding protein
VTKRAAAVLAVIGAVGLLTLGTIVAVGAAQGQFGVSQNLALANCGPRHPQGTVVHVELTDRGGAMMGAGGAMMVSVFASPDIVASGTVTFVATNTGAMNHELLVLPAPTDGVGTRPVGANGKIDESTSLGEASTSCGQGPGGGISPGTTSWVTLHLAPGNYELLCDVRWHYANGMFAGFTVR